MVFPAIVGPCPPAPPVHLGLVRASASLVARRRSLECTPCPAPFVPCCNDKDECCDPYKPGARDLPNNSINITVDAPTLQVCDPWEVGDKITIEGNPPGDTSTVITHEATVMAVTQVYNPDGYTLEILPPLTQDFSPINSEVAQTCTSSDGTQVSASYSPFYGGCCCTCGMTPPTECCLSTEVCTEYGNGTGVCTPAGPYPDFSTPAPTVGAKGDPHLVNLQGSELSKWWPARWWLPLSARAVRDEPFGPRPHAEN